MNADSKILRKDECYAIVGAALALHKELGSGFLEAVYQEGLALAFARAQIPFEAQKELKINLWGTELKKTYVADFVVFGDIIVEIKAIKSISQTEEAQIFNYLKAAGAKVGLLINFGAPRLETKRFVL